jgi:nucleoside-diphosphate-sugar epimerase
MNKQHEISGVDNNMKTRIAIVGATSHIAKGLINHFLGTGKVYLSLFARNAKPVHPFLKKIGVHKSKDFMIYEGYQNFPDYHYDVIINCVGLGTVSEEPHIYTSFFMVTEEFDNLIIAYLTKSPRTLYINFSSGAIYGNNYLQSVDKNSINKIRVNGISRNDYFMIVKLNSESKHRAFEKLNIIDIRVFSYFSRFVDITGKYFITELLNALIHNQVFHTKDVNIVRDYIHPNDLFALVNKCIDIRTINMSLDAYSLQPTSKMDILNFFTSEYKLKYQIEKSSIHRNVTGQKNIYYSIYRKASKIGYHPHFSSLDAIKQETAYILRKSKTKK